MKLDFCLLGAFSTHTAGRCIYLLVKLLGIVSLVFLRNSCVCKQIFWIFEIFLITCDNNVGLGDLGVTCSPQNPMFAGSNPAEVDGFFQNVKILSTSSTGEL